MQKWIEFFHDEKGALSMTRLVYFGAFFVSSYAVIKSSETPYVGEVLTAFLGAFVVGYVGGKGADAFQAAAQSKANANPSVIMPDAGNVNVTNTGDVKITGTTTE